MKLMVCGGKNVFSEDSSGERQKSGKQIQFRGLCDGEGRSEAFSSLNCQLFPAFSLQKAFTSSINLRVKQL
jgi:hypothetical protein